MADDAYTFTPSTTTTFITIKHNHDIMTYSPSPVSVTSHNMNADSSSVNTSLFSTRKTSNASMSNLSRSSNTSIVRRSSRGTRLFFTQSTFIQETVNTHLCHKRESTIFSQRQHRHQQHKQKQKHLSKMKSLLYLSNNKNNNREKTTTPKGKPKVKNQSIEELYQKAMEEDKEWYDSFVKDILGENDGHDDDDNDDDRQNEAGFNRSLGAGEKEERQQVKVVENMKKEKEPRRKENNTETMSQVQTTRTGINSSNQSKNQALFDGEGEEDERRQQRRQRQPKLDEMEVEPSLDREPVSKTSAETITNDTSEIKDQIHKKQGDEDTSSDVDNESDKEEEEYIIQFVDMFNLEQKVPMSIMTKLGYQPSDVVKLRAEVLELIIEDEIEIPKEENVRGEMIPRVPRRWMVESKDMREVKVLQKRKKKVINNEQKHSTFENVRSTPDEGVDEKSIPRSQRRRKGNRRDEYDDINMNERRRRRRDDERRRPSSSTLSKQRRRSSSSDRRQRQSKAQQSNNDSIWMDVPTFKQYLRKEAELRIAILGDDWTDIVKSESEWRLNLYQGWLDLIEDGFGDDVFEDISYAPPEMRSSPPTRRNNISRSRKRNRSDDDILKRSDRRREPNQKMRYDERRSDRTRRAMPSSGLGRDGRESARKPSWYDNNDRNTVEKNDLDMRPQRSRRQNGGDDDEMRPRRKRQSFNEMEYSNDNDVPRRRKRRIPSEEY